MLDPTVKQRIQERYQKMNAEGKLLSRSKLDQFYKTFRDRFGPEKLANLDGEALLETMPNHGIKDCHVYWLEFKNDDEFPTRFGSILGDSAFRFGIFRRKKTCTLVTADEANNAHDLTDLTIDEAIVIARKHRDQLLKGVEIQRLLPSLGTDEKGRTRWIGEGHFLSIRLCQGIRRFLSAKTTEPTWSQRAASVIGELRLDHPWVTLERTTHVRQVDGEVQWRTLARGMTYSIVTENLGGAFKAKACNLCFRFASTFKLADVELLIASRLREEFTPVPSEEAFANLKFGECLPPLHRR